MMQQSGNMIAMDGLLPSYSTRGMIEMMYILIALRVVLAMDNPVCDYLMGLLLGCGDDDDNDDADAVSTTPTPL
jgi:hypothetical protein